MSDTVTNSSCRRTHPPTPACSFHHQLHISYPLFSLHLMTTPPYSLSLNVIAAARPLRPPPTTPRPRARVLKLSREVRLALSDDFDTPRAVRHLASLCALITPHLKELTQGDLGPVISAAKFAADTLSLLGVGGGIGSTAAAAGGWSGTKGYSAGTGGDGGGSVNEDGLPPAREFVVAMVEFRRLVRKSVLERKLTNKLAPAKLMKRLVIC